MDQLEAEEEAQALGQEAEESDMSEENSYDDNNDNPRYDESDNWIPSSPEPHVNSDDEKPNPLMIPEYINYLCTGYWETASSPLVPPPHAAYNEVDPYALKKTSTKRPAWFACPKGCPAPQDAVEDNDGRDDDPDDEDEDEMRE